jgi:hypothetical protein
MGTKNNPGKYDCYTKAEPDEPMFVLLARDEHAPILVRMWVLLKESRGDGEVPPKIAEALRCADMMQVWKAKREEAG